MDYLIKNYTSPNLFSISSIIIIILSSFIALTVFFKSEDRRIGKVWSWFAFSVTTWGVGSFLVSISRHPDLAQFWLKIAYLGAIGPPLFFFHFIYEFTKKPKRIILTFSYILGLFFSLIIFFYPDKFFGDIVYMFNEYYYHRFSIKEPILYLIFYLYFYWFLIGYVFWSILRAFPKSRGIYREQLKYIMIGSCIGWLGAELDFLPVFNIKVYPISNFLIAIYPIPFAYAIIKHKLLEVSIALKKGLIYSVLLTLITLLYFSIVFIGEKALQGVVGYHSHFISLFSACIIAILFNPLRNKIQKFLDFRFFRGTLESLSQEYERLKNELFHTEKLAYIGKLASSVVHEIKNPLTAIKSYCEYAPEYLKDGEFKTKFAKLVPSEINRIENTLSQLLDLAKPTKPNMTQVNFILLVDSTLDLLENNFSNKNIKIIKMYELKDLFFLADEKQLKQVFLNLFLNAIDAMGSEGILKVRIEKTKREIKISIKDTGPGIDKKNIERLFTPFFTTKKHGIGLGLSITQEIIKNHCGKIEVESEVGKGTKFLIKIPLKTD